MNPITRMMKSCINMPLKKALPLLFICSLVLVSTTGCPRLTSVPEVESLSGILYDYKGYTINDVFLKHNNIIGATHHYEKTTTAYKDKSLSQVVAKCHEVSTPGKGVTEMTTEYYENGKLIKTDSNIYDKETTDIIETIIDNLPASSSPTAQATVRPIVEDVPTDSGHETIITPVDSSSGGSGQGQSIAVGS